MGWLAGWLVGWREAQRGPERPSEAQRGLCLDLSGQLWAYLLSPLIRLQRIMYVCMYVCMNPANLRVSRFAVNGLDMKSR